MDAARKQAATLEASANAAAAAAAAAPTLPAVSAMPAAMSYGMPGMISLPTTTPAAAPSDAIQAAMAATLGTIQLPPSGAASAPASIPTVTTPAKSAEEDDDDDDSDNETPQITISYKNKRERIDAFKALLKDKKVPSTAAWPQVMKLIQKDPRFNALEALNEKKQAWNAWKTQRAKEEREEARVQVEIFIFRCISTVVNIFNDAI